ncbi:MAG: hypothetical protein WC989_08345 [Micavibrio sp.]
MRRLSERYPADCGGVLVWILIAVALFAALSYAMMRDGGTGSATGIMGEAQAKLYAAEIIAHHDAVRSAVQRLRIRGCSDTDISFQNAIQGWTNPTAPQDKSCHVYEPSGGGLTYALFPPEGALDASKKTGSMYQKPYPNAGYQFYQVGTDLNDLAFQNNWIRREVCIQINQMLGIDNPGGEPPREINDAAALIFVGVYGPNVADTIGDDAGSGLAGKRAFCRWSGAEVSNYQYNQILIAR